jgi:hypothetical protein
MRFIHNSKTELHVLGVCKFISSVKSASRPTLQEPVILSIVIIVKVVHDNTPYKKYYYLYSPLLSAMV